MPNTVRGVTGKEPSLEKCDCACAGEKEVTNTEHRITLDSDKCFEEYNTGSTD